MLATLALSGFLATACSPASTSLESIGDESTPGASETSDSSGTPTSAQTPTPAPPPTSVPSPTPVERVDVQGRVVSAVNGVGLPRVVVSAGNSAVTTDADGRFVLADIEALSEISVRRPAWKPLTVSAPSGSTAPTLTLEIEPITVKGLRVARDVAADLASFDQLLALAEGTVVNTLVFDTKDEDDEVLYETDVEFAHEIGAVNPVYDPTAYIAEAKARGYYTVTRIVTFEDPLWAAADPNAKLAGSWIDAADPQNWEYPLALADEACALGFDEVQFDYVRFPAGETAAIARGLVPETEAERAAVISAFLDEARSRLHAHGCGISAAIFGIVMSSETDERLGQTPETISAVVDAVSPMLYPSHYSPGWLGFQDPNDHPGPVIAFALDEGEPRLAPDSLVRPWIQGFFYNGSQVQAQIAEADSRGAGWIIWNVFGEYRRDWLPLE
ncbi:MAG: putative glycoside hydrolase [Acidimicrobiales bacterium]